MSHRRRAAGALARLLSRDERALVRIPLLLFQRLHVGLRKRSLLHEPSRVKRPHPRMLLDALVHQRLGVGRLVPLVVAVQPETDQIDDDVLVKFLTVVERDLQDPPRRLGVVSVDVEDRNLHGFRDVRRIEGGAAGRRVRCEADLIVDDDVNRAPRAVSAQLREVEDLRDDPLPRERGVAVEKHGQDLSPALFPRETGTILDGARHPLDDRIDRFQVRRIRGDGDPNLPPALRSPGRARALVIFDVPLVRRKVRVNRPLETGEDALGRVADDVGENVQPPAVRQSHHHVFDAPRAQSVQRGLELQHLDHVDRGEPASNHRGAWRQLVAWSGVRFFRLRR